ncbi:MAG: hypothetical protein GY698_01400 [Actinomycetia bacterium]|nr:hypothetical protein [Actinomycetes bacterium]
MTNRKLLTVATIAGLTLGGLSVSVASAQSDGDDVPASTAETADSTASSDAGDIISVQDTEDPATEEGEVDGDNDSRRGHRGGCDLEEAAAAIGIDEADLRAALDSGDTIAAVAQANGVDAASVIDAMVAAKTEHIEEKVAEGRITQEEADEKLAELEGRVTDRVNGVEEDTEGA